MATKKKSRASDEDGKAREITRTVAVDDPWRLLEAARLAFIRKAQTHPELSPYYLRIAAVLGALPDPTARFDKRGRPTEDADAATNSFLEEATKVLQRYLGASQSEHALAYLAAEDFALTVKAAMLAETLREAAESAYLHLENEPLLWGRPGLLMPGSRKRVPVMGAGPKRPPRLDLETVEEAIRKTYTDPAAADRRAVGALAMSGDYNSYEWEEAAGRFRKAIDVEAVARKVLNAVGVKRRWVVSLFDDHARREPKKVPA